MYLTQILQYLLWPAFIVLSWVVVKTALAAYEKKFPADGRGDKKPETSDPQTIPADRSTVDK